MGIWDGIEGGGAMGCRVQRTLNKHLHQLGSQICIHKLGSQICHSKYTDNIE